MSKDAKEKAQPTFQLDADIPIHSPAEDEFGRRTFARKLADMLRAAPADSSFVVSLEGSWGSGKTSTLQMVEYYLKETTPAPIICWWQPWMISGIEKLPAAFLVQLASAIGLASEAKANKKLSEEILHYAQALIPQFNSAPTLSKWMAGANKALGSLTELNVPRRKDEVTHCLAELGRRVIVVIDDIDRLQPDEVRTVFQIVQTIGNFDGVTFLLSYDPEPVMAALSLESGRDGGAFLEKLVQVSYPLPRVGYQSIKFFLARRLENLMSHYDVEDNEVDRLQLALSEGVAHAMRNARDVHRLINRLNISVPATREEVNVGDVVTFEALAVRFPHVADAIRAEPLRCVFIGFSNQEALAGGVEDLRIDDPNSRYAEDLNFRDSLLSSVRSEERVLLQSLLGFLFPKFKIPPATEPSEWDDYDVRTVRHRDHLLKLLRLGREPGVFMVDDARSFLGDSETRRRILEDVMAQNSLLGWLDFLLPYLNDFETDDVVSLVSDLSNAFARAGLRRNDETHEYFVAGLRLVLKTLEPKDQQERKNLLMPILADTTCVSFTEYIAVELARDHGLWFDSTEPRHNDYKTIIGIIATQDLIRTWCNAAFDKMGDLQQLVREPCFIDILLGVGQLTGGNYQHSQDCVSKLTSTHQGLSIFLKAWGDKLTALEVLVPDWKEFEEACKRHVSSHTLRSDLWDYLDTLRQQEAESEGNPDSPDNSQTA